MTTKGQGRNKGGRPRALQEERDEGASLVLDKGWTQKAAAKRMGYSDAAIRKWIKERLDAENSTPKTTEAGE